MSQKEKLRTFKASWKATVPSMKTQTGNITFTLPEKYDGEYVRWYARSIVERSLGPGIEVSIPLVEEVYFDVSNQTAAR